MGKKFNLEKINDGVYLDRTPGKERIVRPIKIDPYFKFSLSNIHWANLLYGGSLKRFVLLLIVIGIILMASWGYSTETKQCKEVMEDPCGLSLKIQSMCDNSSMENIYDPSNNFIIPNLSNEPIII